MAKTGSHKHAVMAMISLCIMYAIYTGVMFNNATLFMQPMVEEFGWLRSQWMLLITVMGVLNAIGALVFYVPMIQKLGMVQCRWIGGIALTAACFILANTPNFPVFIIAGVLLGFGINFGSNGLLSLAVNDWFKKRMSLMISIGTTVGGVVAIIMAPIVGGWVGTMGWRQAMTTIGIIVGIGTVVMCLLYRNKPEDVGETAMWEEEAAAEAKAAADLAAKEGDKKAAEAGTYTYGYTRNEMFKKPRFWVLLVCAYFVGVITYSVMGNMAIFTSDFGFDGATQGTVLSVIFLATAIAMIPGGWLIDKLGSGAFNIITGGCMVIALLILLTGGAGMGIGTIYMAAVFIGISYVAVNVPWAAITMDALGPDDFARKFPFPLGLMLAGVATGNPILQLFFDLGGSYTPGFIFYLIVIVLVTIGIFIITAPGRKARRLAKRAR